MYARIAAALLTSGIFTTGVAFSQTPAPNPTQQPTTIIAADGQIPIFRISVVGRTTSAINYRPRSGDSKVNFIGTPLMPRATGYAMVSGKQGYMEVDARFNRLEPPTKFGREYLTYVLWAVTPEGRATNLGEVQFDDDDARVKVTTELQAFGLILTAEPYFAVTQPSDVVVAENEVGRATEGTTERIEAKYELLKRGSYLMNQDAALLKVKPLEPGAPLDLAEARNAVELARLAGAERYAPETFAKAAGLLATAEKAREEKKRGNEIMQPARQAAQTAEDARLVGLQRREAEFQAEQRRLTEEASARADAEAARRRQAEENARLSAEQARLSADSEAAAARAKAEADAARLAAENARSQADAATRDAEAAKRQAEAEAARQRALADQAEREKAALRDQLRQQLNVILETRETARGLIVNLSDVLFDFNKADLKPGAREKLAKVSGILVSHPGLKLEVEGHTDSVGSNEYNLTLSERRAESVRSYLVDQRIVAESISCKGFGEEQPVATNDTPEGRQQNRRVELVVSGAPIGTR